MPENVSESDNQLSSKINLLRLPKSSLEIRSSSKLSTTSGRCNLNVRNVKSNLENLLTEEEACLENLSDENEEYQQSSIPKGALQSYES